MRPVNSAYKLTDGPTISGLYQEAFNVFEYLQQRVYKLSYVPTKFLYDGPFIKDYCSVFFSLAQFDTFALICSYPSSLEL